MKKMNDVSRERVSTVKQYNERVLTAKDILTGRQFRNKKRKQNQKRKLKNKKL